MRANESCFVLIPFDILMIWFLRPRHRQLYARIRVGMLAAAALLMVVGVLSQPIWPLLLWPLVPALVVGFWPPRDKTHALGDAAKPHSSQQTRAHKR